MIWTLANEHSKPAHLQNEGEAGRPGFFETASKESVKVVQQCQEFFRLIEPTVIAFAISSGQFVKAGITKAILNEPGFLNHPGSQWERRFGLVLGDGTHEAKSLRVTREPTAPPDTGSRCFAEMPNSHPAFSHSQPGDSEARQFQFQSSRSRKRRWRLAGGARLSEQKGIGCRQLQATEPFGLKNRYKVLASK